MSPTQRQLILGTLLGDAAMSFYPRTRVARYHSNHGFGQHEYNCLKYRTLSSLVRTPPAKRKNLGYGEWSSVFQTTCHPVLFSFADLCYRVCPEKGKLVKTVNPAWLAEVGPEGLAWWLGDDGSYNTANHCLSIHTEGFPLPQVTMLADWFRDRWGVAASPYPVSDGKYHILQLTVDGTDRLASLVQPYLVAPMGYKVPAAPVQKTQPCTFCGVEVRRSTRKSPEERTRAVCCGAAVCRKAESKARNDRYRTADKQVELNAAAKARYWADPEAARAACREKQRQAAALRTAEEREALLARRRELRAAAKAKRDAARPPVPCRECGTLFVPADPRQRYCPEHRRPSTSTRPPSSGSSTSAGGTSGT